MLYDIESDKWREECGVFGIFASQENVALSTYWGLYALQHRGQESAGIAVTDGQVMDVQRGMGLVNEVFRHNLPEMPARIAIGHVRYSTTGSSLLRNTQPLLVNYSGGQIRPTMATSPTPMKYGRSWSAKAAYSKPPLTVKCW